ncbi:helix-turn-helix transcriptional regulator [Methylobacterium sp. Leaf93]|uniref:helix-turn-helix domain-containing protein n=1 Tax=Methylobacterium sp. Leaf93 TaxID=1736249 RepID=UPI0006F6CE83|nr:helix-turn-helix transcriptional regulator [Methylobacterium sp. Leaf93]KQP16404.1 transcriptional regulator [Methylobacterium sp. Leaf93]
MTIVRTQTPSGESIVIMPEAEFERLAALAEDASDLQTLVTSQTRLASGEDELLNEADFDALRHAQSPLAFWRARRRLSTTELAARSGISHADLTAIEDGTGTSDIVVLRSLADALGVDLEDLVPAAPVI